MNTGILVYYRSPPTELIFIHFRVRSFISLYYLHHSKHALRLEFQDKRNGGRLEASIRRRVWNPLTGPGIIPGSQTDGTVEAHKFVLVAVDKSILKKTESNEPLIGSETAKNEMNINKEVKTFDKPDLKKTVV